MCALHFGYVENCNYIQAYVITHLIYAMKVNHPEHALFRYKTPTHRSEVQSSVSLSNLIDFLRTHTRSGIAGILQDLTPEAHENTQHTSPTAGVHGEKLRTCRTCAPAHESRRNNSARAITFLQRRRRRWKIIDTPGHLQTHQKHRTSCHASLSISRIGIARSTHDICISEYIWKGVCMRAVRHAAALCQIIGKTFFEVRLCVLLAEPIIC